MIPSTSTVIIQVGKPDYAFLIELLDSRIRSERARASAYRCRADPSNEMIAQGQMARLFTLRNTIVESCRIEVDDV